MPQSAAILIGFRYTTLNNGRFPGVIQPIYLTATGEVYGKIYGVAPAGAVPQIVKAKPGYAVGAIYVRGGGGLDAFKPIFMRVKENGLNTTDSYEGPHIGGTGGGEGTAGGDGNFIIGLHGKVSDQGKIEALSAVSLAAENGPSSNDRGPAPKKGMRTSGKTVADPAKLTKIQALWHTKSNPVDLLATMRGATVRAADGDVVLTGTNRLVTPKSYRPPVAFRIVRKWIAPTSASPTRPIRSF